MAFSPGLPCTSKNLRENAVQSGGDTHEHAGPWLLTLVSLLMWERRVDPDLQFRIKVWQTVHFHYGCTFQVDVKEGMHTGAGDRQSATLIERSHHPGPAEKEHQNWTLGEHLVTEGEMICAHYGHSPAFPFRNVVIDRFNVPFDRLWFRS